MATTSLFTKLHILGATVRFLNTRVLNTWTGMEIRDYFEEQTFISSFHLQGPLIMHIDDVIKTKNERIY